MRWARRSTTSGPTARAKHAFAKETADSKNLPILKYDAAAAELARRRTMDFLAKHLA
jgi:dienelactone hydrolase